MTAIVENQPIETPPRATTLKELFNLLNEAKEQKEQAEILKRHARYECKNCHQRGHIGWNQTTKKYVICKCIIKKFMKG